jgi:GxxExxY protein
MKYFSLSLPFGKFLADFRGCKRGFSQTKNLFMKENEISYLIRGCAFKVHRVLGPGLLESVYEAALSYELVSSGLYIENQKGIPMMYKEIKFDFGFRMDILVNNLVIVEVKSVETLADIHHKQLLTYLKLMDKKLGLLINFNSFSLDATSMIRIVHNL